MAKKRESYSQTRMRSNESLLERELFKRERLTINPQNENPISLRKRENRRSLMIEYYEI